MSSVDFSLTSITTDSIITASLPISSSSSTDLLHPLKSVCPSTNALNSLHQLKVSSMTVSTDDSHQLTTTGTSTNLPSSTVVDHIIAQTLLGLREGSESVERQPWELAKGESVEGLANSSSQEKGEDLSGSLAGTSEGEVSCVVRQGEPLMQE